MIRSEIKESLADDVEIARRVLAHIDAGTTDEGAPWREPVDHYLNPDRFADEWALLRSLPSVFAPSLAIPNPGDHVARMCFGVSLFAVRGHDGRARVFRNACRHRGMTLVEGSGCSHALVCRYHGWTYKLDGSLSHVPHAGAFPDLELSTRGLVEIDSHEVGGLIVIGPVAAGDGGRPDAGADPDLAALTSTGPWGEKLSAAARLVHTDTAPRPMNWKVLAEQFLEGYHIRSTHRQTFYPLQYDNLNIVETFGPNSRLTFPYRNIERLRDRPESSWTVDARVTYVYYLFPNVVVATFPDLILMAAIDPIDVGQSTITSYIMTKHDTDAQMEFTSDDLINRGLTEDNEMSAGVQIGLRTGANEFLQFGRNESAIGHFHSNLAERLTRLRG